MVAIAGLVLEPLPVGAWAMLAVTTAVATKTLTFAQVRGCPRLMDWVEWLEQRLGTCQGVQLPRMQGVPLPACALHSSLSLPDCVWWRWALAVRVTRMLRLKRFLLHPPLCAAGLHCVHQRRHLAHCGLLLLCSGDCWAS